MKTARLYGVLATLGAVAPVFASAQTLDSFNTALTDAVSTSTSMIASVGGKGVVLLLATLAVAVVVIFIRIGFKKGVKAMQGRH